MQSIKLIKCALFLILTGNLLLCGMSGDRGSTGPGFPRRPDVSGLPPIAGEPQIDVATAQVLDRIAQESHQKQEAQEESEENFERPAKRKKMQIFVRRVDLGGLEEPADELDYVVDRLIVVADAGQRITSEQIRHIGERFLNIRELELAEVELRDEGLRILSEQQIVANLVRLDISRNAITAAGLNVVSKFTGLKSLNIAFNAIGDAGLEAIAQIGIAPDLIELTLSDTLITAQGVQAHIGAFTNLISLNIGCNNIGDLGFAAIAQAPFAANLTSLNIDWTDITTQGIQANIAAFTGVRSLTIALNCIRDEGLSVIAQAPFARNLTELIITHTGITAEGVQANIAKFRGLRMLDIDNNTIGDAGLEAIAQAPFARNLTELTIARTDITPRGVQANIGAFTSLRSLDIAGNWIRDGGVAAIAQAPFARNLTELSLQATGITNAGIEATIQAFVSLIYLNISHSYSIDNEGIALIAQQPFASRLTLNVASTGVTRNWLIQHQNEFKAVEMIDKLT